MKITLLFLLPFLPLYVFAQICGDSVVVKAMNTPRASFLHSPKGRLWWDGTPVWNDDRIPSTINDPTLSTAPAQPVFAGEFWYGAQDQNGNLYIRANTDKVDQTPSAFSLGPITSDFPNAAICSLFNRVWEIQRTEINAHTLDWFDNQTIDNPIPDNIKHWPGRGNQFITQDFGVALPDLDLAPFWDQNNNGKYEPDLGDFPDSRGAAIAHWWMFNDTGDNAQSQVGIPTADFAVLAYSFDDELSTTTTYYYEYLMTNRSQIDFAEMRTGLWVKPSLGCKTDDNLGCFPEKDLAYVYNDDFLDGTYGNDCQTNVQTFDLDIPLFGIKVLDGTDRWDATQGWIDNGMSSFIYMNDNDEGPPGTFFPYQAYGYWNYLKGKWRDGTSMSSGGWGYHPSPMDTTFYAFPNYPNDTTGWSMCTYTFGEGDRSFLISIGPFNIAPGKSQKFAFAALVTSAIDDYPCPSIDPLVEAADAAQEVYDGIISSQQSPASIAEPISIFPNPTSDILNINLGQSTFNQFQIYDSQGKLIQTQILHQQNVQFSMEHLPKGLYILSFKNAVGQIYNQRIVKI